MKNFWTPRYFLFKLSLHVGVVTICSMGIMLYTISFFINMFGKDPETKDELTIMHWFIVILFIVIGFTIYIIGLLSAYNDSPLYAKITCFCLCFHFFIWLILTGLSFVNNLTINSIVCIDNRCADRLFIKNGNWRRADASSCDNPSKLRGVLLGDIDIEEEEGENPQNSGAGETKSVDEIQEQEEDEIHDRSRKYSRNHPSYLEKHTNLHARSMQQHLILQEDQDDVVSYFMIPPRKINNDILLNSSNHQLKNQSSMVVKNSSNDMNMSDVLIRTFSETSNRSVSSDNGTVSPNDTNNLINTPFGYVGCNAPQHIAFSVICALLIMCLWYVYPILIFHAYSKKVGKKRASMLTRKSIGLDLLK
uniref:Interferon-induced guanylate-binding protein 1 n=2 Tax=Lygus hesperus TaxID=30085 RepID=A0A0A9ZI23_LYGHE